MITSISNTGYEVISSGVLSAFLAQVLKFIIFTIKSRKINLKSLQQQAVCRVHILQALWLFLQQ